MGKSDPYVKSWKIYSDAHVSVCGICQGKGLSDRCYPYVREAWFFHEREKAKMLSKSVPVIEPIAVPQQPPHTVAFRKEAVKLIARGLRHLIKDLKYRASRVSPKTGEELRQQIEECEFIIEEIEKREPGASQSTDPA